MTKDDVGYYHRRAEAELEQAQRATNPEVVRVHSDMANAYLQRVAEAPPIQQTNDA